MDNWKITDIKEGRIFEQICTGRLLFVPKPQPSVLKYLIDKLIKTK